MNPLGAAQSFIFGGNTDAPTVESLRKRREIADLLAQQSAGGEYRNWGDGVGSLMKAVGYRLMDNKLKPQEDAERQKIADLLGSLGGGGYTPSYTGPVGGASGGFTGAGAAPQGASVAPTASNPNIPAADTGNPIYQGLVQRGLPEPVAQGFMMNFADESGLNPGINEQNPTVPGSRGGFGLAQWTGPRRQALEQFAAQSGKPLDDADTQLDFLMTELQGPEAGAASKFMGATDPGQAAAGIAQHFLRPAPENLAPRLAEYMGGGGGAMGMMGGGGEPDMGKLQQLAEVLSNPYADEGQKTIAQLLIKREMDSGGGGMTPYQAAQLGLDTQRLGLERDKFAAGTREGVQSFGAINYAERDDPSTPEVDPKMSPYVTDKAGQVKWLDLGGADARPPVQWQDTGTEKVPVYSSGGGRAGDPLAVDKAGVAAQAEIGKAAGTAAASLGDREISVQAAIDQIDRISNDPALPSITGSWEGNKPTWMMDQAAANLTEQLSGLTSKTFSNAIDALRGLGAMTEAEGKAATGALANLSRIQDETALKDEMARLGDMLKGKLEVARQKAAGVTGAGGDMPQAARDAGINPDLWQFMSPEDRALWN